MPYLVGLTKLITVLLPRKAQYQRNETLNFSNGSNSQQGWQRSSWADSRLAHVVLGGYWTLLWRGRADPGTQLLMSIDQRQPDISQAEAKSCRQVRKQVEFVRCLNVLFPANSTWRALAHVQLT